jgi:hypothetical protein
LVPLDRAGLVPSCADQPPRVVRRLVTAFTGNEILGPAAQAAGLFMWTKTYAPAPARLAKGSGSAWKGRVSLSPDFIV